ncbi:MAG: hypothetical protein AAF567_18420 [Actinomycetota bacterium]
MARESLRSSFWVGLGLLVGGTVAALALASVVSGSSIRPAGASPEPAPTSIAFVSDDPIPTPTADPFTDTGSLGVVSGGVEPLGADSRMVAGTEQAVETCSGPCVPAGGPVGVSPASAGPPASTDGAPAEITPSETELTEAATNAAVPADTALTDAAIAPAETAGDDDASPDAATAPTEPPDSAPAESDVAPPSDPSTSGPDPSPSPASEVVPLGELEVPDEG